MKSLRHLLVTCALFQPGALKRDAFPPVVVDFSRGTELFVANLSDPHLGVATWCNRAGAHIDDCYINIAADVRSVLIHRSQRPVSAIDFSAGAGSWKQLHHERRQCSDRYPSIGECSLLQSLFRHAQLSRTPGAIVFSAASGIKDLSDAAAAIAHEHTLPNSDKPMLIIKMVPFSCRQNNMNDNTKDKRDIDIRLARGGMDLGTEEPQLQLYSMSNCEESSSAAPKMKAISVLIVNDIDFEATFAGFEQLYDLVSPGGVVLLRSFGASSEVRRAFSYFFSTRNLRVPLLERYGPYCSYFYKNLNSNWHGQGMRVEVILGNSESFFDSDASLVDFGAPGWCQARGALDVAACASYLLAAVHEAGGQRNRRPRSLVEDQDLSGDHPLIFPPPYACTDDQFESGRCMLTASLVRYTVLGKVPGSIVGSAGRGSGELFAAMAGVLSSRGSEKQLHLQTAAEEQEPFHHRLAQRGVQAPQVQWCATMSDCCRQPKLISFLFLSAEDYDGIRGALAACYGKVAAGGVIALSAFGRADTARLALSDFFLGQNPRVFPLVERYGDGLLWLYKGSKDNVDHRICTSGGEWLQIPG